MYMILTEMLNVQHFLKKKKKCLNNNNIMWIIIILNVIHNIDVLVINMLMAKCYYLF